MHWAGERLRKEGYRSVHAPTFAYHTADLDHHAAHAAKVMARVAERHPDAELDVVTHSYGGVLARAALTRPEAPRVRRLVMLSPPNQGASWAAMVRKALPLHVLGWDPLAQFHPERIAPRPVPEAEIGVLTGGLGHARGFNPLLGADNDGTVRVDEAYLPGANDFRVLPIHHSFMPLSARALDDVVHFLERGRFSPHP